MKNESVNIKKSFLPIIDCNSRILILGSMPGEESLRRQEYYGHPRNAFWRIMGDLFSFSVDLDYKKRVAKLLENKIALWDVLQSCRREGSLDSYIREEIPNDFYTLFRQYPGIKTVAFNGKKAFQSYLKIQKLKELKHHLISLPSTSPAYTLTYDKKLEAWKPVKVKTNPL